jgi:PTH1 family peptidyl-tRNA hydrolase
MSLKLIVGLGNPGVQYARNRHNVGFMVVDELARRLGASWARRGHAELAEVRAGTARCWLMKPQTFMNLSGEAVLPFVRFHKLEPADILVVHDEMDLPFGRVRLRVGGSAGGSNGVKNVISRLGTDRFARLKVGVSRPPEGWEVVNWVLSNFQPDEAGLLQEVVRVGADALEASIRDGVLKSQNAFNSVDLRPKPAEPVSAEAAVEARESSANGTEPRTSESPS